MKPFRKGLVAGKFSPLHLGHEALIEYAIAQCEQVLILSYSNPEFPKCGRAERERWLKGRFPQLEVVVLDQTKVNELAAAAMIDTRGIPTNDCADRKYHRSFVAWALLDLIGTTVDAVFTSEDYGDQFAAHLEQYFKDYIVTAPAVKHICYDKERKNYPFSGTEIREDFVAAQKHVSSNVFASLMPRVGIIGSQGSGKTTLAKALAAELETGWVSEYLKDERDRLHEDIRYEDIIRIGKAQVKSELVLARRFGNKVLVCDTTPLCLLRYAYTRFWAATAEVQSLAKRSYDYIILCDYLECEDPHELSHRQTDHSWYVNVLQGKRYLHVTGSVEDRVAQSKNFLGL